MKQLWVSLCFAFLLSLSQSAWAQVSEDALTEVALGRCFSRLEETIPIQIEFRHPERVIYPDWFKAPFFAKFETLDRASALPVCEALLISLEAYPPKLLRQNLRTVALFKKLVFYEQIYRASYLYDPEQKRGDLMIATLSFREDLDIPLWVVDSFHHEFSSVLIQKYPFPEKAWRKANPSDFQYTLEAEDSPGVEALKKGFGTAEEEALLEMGFLSQYATASFEEDLNFYAGQLFSVPAHLLELAQTYPVIGKKVKILLQFYLSLDAEFIKTAVFQKFAQAGMLEQGL
ncbi:hypothetical protein COW36_18275 [bacterium (Candidatus Blackallbacteria) CG17_big_fil_post_rev_8_21_14_2_50_48_46]|uniref:Uncharacterized protein n=1 Tax=bacterium (Candidatus Blackallbacteria) CG17_big_fil_post_rev_8_21_14_2_50_48_46 TaxID=2014261 RepID=A0A2M7G191_9BACT|nr:MAG: hypothetical protein COW64_00460 [bacterium (Candidatus Blackallbacteria) CG18_big_fil_WC_8_21_14_2_50_49_26]PIW15363.1 MAG: hypothetical protein COW36_18275 [bacterium (Candidatus Blackallbacteria) CG17_big_fil_post_rev_8_21_14_2_50_48_46]PIW49776.1 MAG: hypothetical protein COW20_05090 [bacterium (Candidatus Blackallbacteria) CG13_big_fil_rev_8_21_14_2_50_49_14]